MATKIDTEAIRKALGLKEGETAQMGTTKTGDQLLTGFTTPTTTPKTTAPITYPSSVKPTTTTVAPTAATTGGKELPFPTNQAQMAEYQAKHTFTGGKWYEGKEGVAPTTVAPTAQLPPASSEVQAGKDYLSAHQGMTELQVKDLYRQRGFEQKYGSWTGSATQWKAMTIQDEVEAKQQEIAKKTEEYNKQLAIETEQAKTGQGQTVFNAPATDGEVSVQMTPDDIGNTIQDTIDKIGTTDIATLISQVSTGELTTPEMVLSEEDKKAALDKIKVASTQALQTMQQNLAKRGMSFSGIRTQAEADLAAKTLAAEAGINRDFAARIVNAARQEQTRRETALQAAEDNYNKALTQSGYVYNPFTDTIQPTLEREKFEAEQAQAAREPAKTMTVGNNVYQYNPDNTLWEPIIGGTELEAPKTLSTEQGILQWNTETGDWENTGYTAPKNELSDALTLLKYQAQTAVAPGQIVHKITGQPLDLPANVSQKLSGLKSYIDSEGTAAYQRILELLKDPEVNTEGAIKKAQEYAYRKAGGILGKSGLTEKEAELSDLMAIMANEYLYTRSGAQINEKEQKRLKDVQAIFGYSNSDNIRRATEFMGVLQNIINENLSIYGATFAGEQTGAPTGETNVNINDPLGIR